MGRGKERARSGEGGEVQQSRHPSHAVAAQPHFATSILPARLHSHSVDPFTEGMSHMPPSPLPPPFPPFPPPYSLLSFKPPHPAPCSLLAHPPRFLSPSVRLFLFLSYPAVHPSPPPELANVCPPVPQSLFLSSLSRRLPFSLTCATPPKCPSFSPSLLCGAGR